jgi:hypothetical protein
VGLLSLKAFSGVADRFFQAPSRSVVNGDATAQEATP